MLFTIALVVAIAVYAHIASGGDWRAWFEPTPVLSLAGLVIGFIVVGWQLDRQHRNTVEANRVHAQNQLKLEIYEEITRRAEATGEPLSEAANMPGFFIIELKYRMKLPVPLVNSKYSFNRLESLHRRCSDSIVGLMTTFENYEIVMPGFGVFLTKLGYGHQALTKAFGDFNLVASNFADPKFAAVQWPPTAEELTKVESLGRAVSDAAWDLTMVVEDLRKASQNFLLGKLFPGSRAEERKPADPTVEVTRIPSPQEEAAD